MPAPVPCPIALDLTGMPAELGSIEVLARMQLGVRRLDGRLELHGATQELLDLIAFAGLGDVLGVKAEREPEEREQPLRVEEERDLGDSPI
jgi:hypothetical protein